MGNLEDVSGGRIPLNALQAQGLSIQEFTPDVLRNPRSEICCAIATGSNPSNDLASAHTRALPSPGHDQWAKSFPLGQPPRNQQFAPSRLLEHVNSLKPWS